MGHRGANSVHPDMANLFARRDDGSSIKLLGIEVVFDVLRSVLPLGDDIWQGLAEKTVAKTGLVPVGVVCSRLGAVGCRGGALSGRRAEVERLHGGRWAMVQCEGC